MQMSRLVSGGTPALPLDESCGSALVGTIDVKTRIVTGDTAIELECVVVGGSVKNQRIHSAPRSRRRSQAASRTGGGCVLLILLPPIKNFFTIPIFCLAHDLM